MATPFFSVVIPTYNTVKYLADCVRSILSQSFEDFEIILIDDESSDGTGELADKLAAGEARIRSFHIPHGGVSAARNAGLKEAAGKYVLFMDSDDMLAENALGIIKANLSGEPDMLWFGFRYMKQDGSVQEGQRLRNLCYSNASDAAMIWIKNNMLPVSACNKSFRLSCIKKHSVEFREDYSFGEDRLFMLDFLKHCGRIVTISENLYVYMIRAGSASHRFVPDILGVMLSLHKERQSAIIPLCSEKMSEKELKDFTKADYVKSVLFAWTALSNYYANLTAEQKKRELQPYLDINPPSGITSKILGFRTYILYASIKTAARLKFLLLLKFMMFITRLLSGKVKI